MKKIRAKLFGLLKSEAGQGMTEYGLIIALIAIVVIGAVAGLGTYLKGLFTQVTTDIQNPPAN